MSALLFIIRRSLKNIIKGVFKKFSTLIGYIVVIAFLALTLILSMSGSGGNIRSAPPELFNGIAVLVFTIMYYTSLSVGIEKGSTYFRMADVNFLFTSPIRPNDVLLYGFLKNIGGTFIMVILTFFQIPNIKNNFVLQPYGIWMLLAAVAAYALSFPLISIIIYSWSSKEKKRRQILKRILNIAVLAIGAIALISLSQTRNLGSTIETVFNNPVFKYFPVIGWTASIASYAVSGFTPEFWVGASGMLALIVGISISLYFMKLDFYEDVLVGTEYVESALKAKREGKSIKFNAKIKNKENLKLGGKGASVIFSRQLLDIRRYSHFFFIDSTTLWIIIAGIGFRFIMPDEVHDFSMLLVVCFSVYMLLIFQMQGRLNTELEKHYIYLIPASSHKKLFYATFAEHVKNLADGVILSVISGLLFKSDIGTIAACALTYIAYGGVFVYTDVLCRKLLGKIHGKTLVFFIKLMVTLLILIPSIVSAIVAGAVTGSEFWTIFAMGGTGLILALTLYILSAGILDNIEVAG